MARLGPYIAYGLIAAFAVWCVAAFHADLAQIPLRTLSSSGDVLLAVAALSLINYTLRVVRWRGYLTRLGHPFPLRTSAAFYVSGFAFTLAPGKLGELARGRYYAPLGVPLAAVAGAFLIERLMDLLAIAAIASLAIQALGRFRPLLWLIAAVIVFVLLGLASWSRITARLDSARKPFVPRRLAGILQTVSRSLSQAGELLRFRVLAASFMLSLAAWGAEAAGLGILVSLFPPAHFGFVLAAGIYAIAVLLGALSFLPGGLGTTEALMTALLAAGGLRLSDAMLATLLCRLLTLWFAVALGWLAVVGLRRRPEVVPRCP
ncbi:MAG: lysylphosphatidylglycerol synthase transmembrane domain-containing protein [Steroidobacteraceae bacterium]